MLKINCEKCGSLEPEIKIRRLPDGGSYCQECAVMEIELRKRKTRIKRSIYIDHLENDDSHYKFMTSWFSKWGSNIHIENHSSGGWEHCWDLEGPVEAFDEIPKDYFCHSDWAEQ